MTAEHTTTAPDADSRRWLALVVLCVGMLMIVLDVTVVNVALPSIQDDLGFSQSNLAWVVNAYLISFGGLLLLAGRLGDLIGRRRVFLIGLAIFTVASLLCGVAQSQGLLIAARFVQGVGGAMTSAVILGMIVTMFPDPKEQAKAIGIYGFVASAGGSIGLLAGGVLTEGINWHWIFFINLPIAIGTALLATRLIDADEGIGIGRGADVLGAVLVTGLPDARRLHDRQGERVRLGRHAHARAWECFLLALLAAFVVRQARAANPLMPLHIFRSRNVSGANLVQVVVVAGMFGMFFLGTLYLERVLGFDPLEIGLAFLPATIVMGIFSAGLSARLNERYGARVDAGARARVRAHGPGAVRPCAGGRQLPGRRAPAGDPARDRGRPRVPLADDARDVGRHAGRRRPGLRSREHHGAGGRRARARGPGDPRHEPHARPARVG